MKFYGMRAPFTAKIFGWFFMFHLYRVDELPTDLDQRRELALRVDMIREKNGWSKNRIDRIKALKKIRYCGLVYADHWVRLAFGSGGNGEIL